MLCWADLIFSPSARARSDQVESGTRSRFLIWSHFLRRTASHFAGKCSSIHSGKKTERGRDHVAMHRSDRSGQGRRFLAGGLTLAATLVLAPQPSRAQEFTMKFAT